MTLAQDIAVEIASSPLVTVGGLVYVPPFEIPGITAADALDANDALGIAFKIPVPPAGEIKQAYYHDLDDEGFAAARTLHLYISQQSAIASDAAYAPVDADNILYIGRIRFDAAIDLANNQIGIPNVADIPLFYVAPQGFLWAQVQTAGTDNITAGSMPRLSFVIQKHGS